MAESIPLYETNLNSFESKKYAGIQPTFPFLKTAMRVHQV